MKYPCDCEDMKWLIDNNDVFINHEGRWMLKWTEMDKTQTRTNIQAFAIRMYHCVFCGKKLNQEAE